MKKHSRGFLSFFVIIISTLLVVSGCKSGSETDKAGKAPSGKRGPMTLNGFILRPQKMDNVVRTTGSVMANEEVELHAETSGKIIKIYFTEDSHVKKGELLVKINDEELQAQLKKNELQIKLLEEQMNRKKQLLEINATSQEEFDILQNQLNTAKADRDVIQAAIDKTEIKAPFNGVIGLKYVSNGSYVTPSTRIATVQNIDPVKVDFTVPEKYVAMVKKGDEVFFSSDATSQNFTGTVYAIEPKINVSTRTLQIRALCPNANNKILPGSFTNVELRLKQTDDALLIPTQALIPVLKGQIVYIYKNGVAESIPVKTGKRNNVNIQITEGLSPGDTVITTGIMSLKPKMSVEIVINNDLQNISEEDSIAQ